MTEQKSLRQGVATLRDVAKHAGVSLMTASIVANGRAGRVSTATRERVAAAIAELRYRPNASARSLRLAKGYSVGMIVLDASPRFLAAPFTTHLVAGLSNGLGVHGYALTIQGLVPSAVHEALVLRTHGADGLCVLTAGTAVERRRFLDALAALEIPVVLFEETLDPESTDCCVIRQDDRGGGRLLGRHALAAGAKRLVMLVPGQEWPSIDERRKGIEEAMHEAGGKAHLHIAACGDEGLASTRNALVDHLERFGRPDAVLAGNDQMGIAALLALKAAGLTVPGDVMVTGFNGFAFRDYSDPLLTTVRSAAYEMGIAGADALIGRLDHGRFQEPRVTLPVQLMQGRSTPSAPVD